MDIRTAKDYFDAGVIHSVIARAPDALHGGWTLEFSGERGNWDPLLRTARGNVRTFKTLDAAAKAVREIGFQQWSVITD